jgi:hypothetical protein
MSADFLTSSDVIRHPTLSTTPRYNCQHKLIRLRFTTLGTLTVTFGRLRFPNIVGSRGGRAPPSRTSLGPPFRDTLASGSLISGLNLAWGYAGCRQFAGRPQSQSAYPSDGLE